MMANKKKGTKGKTKPTPKGSASSSKKTPNLEKLKKGYRVRVSIDGERVSKTAKTRSEALKIRSKLKEKQSKVIPVRKRKDITEGRKGSLTKKAVKEGKLKIVSPKTGRSKAVEPVSVKLIPISRPQEKKKESGKAFYQDVMDGKIVPAMMAISDDQQTPISVRWSGQVVICNPEQLSQLVNMINKGYSKYVKDKKIPSPVIRYRMDIDPATSTELNLDESFFNDDGDEPFDVGDFFFQWSEDID